MNYVGQIHDAILTSLGTTLGSPWVKLRKVFKPEENDLRVLEKAYGCLHGEAPNFAGAEEAFVYDQQFTVILSRRASNRDDDAEIQTVINDLYDKMDNCLRAIILTQLGLSNIILDIDAPAMGEPEVLDNGAVILRSTFNIKHWLDRIVT